MMIRPLTELSEFETCVQLQRACWDIPNDVDLVPSRIYLVQTHIGGLVLGAFEGDRLVGFVNAMPGIRDGMPYWHSQMMGIAADHRNSGIGSQLKLAQREHARQRGIHLIQWTYDPLESRNAYLNVQKLGAIVRHYHVNLYGTTTARINKGLDTDRVIAEWWIDRPRVEVTGDVRRLFIPADIQSLKKQSLKSAQDVQLRVREQFLKNLQDDYFVAGFERTDEWNAYLFVAGASRVDKTD
jgi:predicted GNAT superfamily acetyltransferase